MTSGYAMHYGRLMPVYAADQRRRMPTQGNALERSLGYLTTAEQQVRRVQGKKNRKK